VQRSLEHSVKSLVEDKLLRYDLGEREGFRVLNTHIETPGDGLIIFNGMQNHTAESIKSLEGFDRAWVEEAQSLSDRSWTLLRPTMFRKKGTEIWCSWNPRFPTDPIDDFFRGNAPRKPGLPPWAPPPDSVLLRTSYRDNPYVLPDLLKEIEWDKARDPEKYAHVWLGEYERNSEARVFKNWRVEEFDDPSDATFYYGGDWGFSVDPSVLVRMRVDGRNLYIGHEAYKVGVEIDHLPQLFDQVPGAREWVITADSARPETISYLQRHGFPRLRPAVKGANSVKEGVIFLQGYDIIIHPRCVHAIDEFTLYSYEVDEKTGLITPKLADKKNHVIDSVRYAVEPLRAPVYQNWAVV
jgi:phage terminase large subunit